MNDKKKSIAVTLAIDAMGGDHAPEAPLLAGKKFLQKHPLTKLLLVGDEKKIMPYLQNYRRLADRVEVRHSPDIISNEAKPADALRQGKQSSMAMAIKAVAMGEADAVVSGGNTGALMAFAMFGLQRIKGIDRPAICSAFPTMEGMTCALDLGANLRNTAEELCQFALLGSEFAKVRFHKQKPTVGIVNVGHEANKGYDYLQRAAEILQKKQKPFHQINYYGFIEGDDIAKGTVDVCVTDGFVGNVILKTAEGIGRMVGGKLKATFRADVRTRLSYLLAHHQMKKIRNFLDPRLYNGAPFLGLNNIAIKSHGSSDKLAFATALDLAYELVASKMITNIKKNLESIIN